MQLSDIAARDVIDVRPSDTTDTAISLMEEHGIHHLPVVEDGKPVGIVSDRDLLESVGWMLSVERTDQHDGRLVGPRFVSDVMSSPVHTLRPDQTITDAAHLMLQEGIGAVLLVASDRLVGLVAESDVLHCYVDGNAHFSSSRWRFHKVVDHMAANVLSLDPGDPIVRATRLMKEKHLRHVPLVDGNALIGMVSDRDIRQAAFREHVRWLNDEDGSERVRTNLRDVMSKRPLRVFMNDTLADVASRMIEARIGALPVVNDGHMCGIITETDLLRAFLHGEE